MNLPNILTMVRIALIPVFMILAVLVPTASPVNYILIKRLTLQFATNPNTPTDR